MSDLLRPNRRRFEAAFFIHTGFTPWGRELPWRNAATWDSERRRWIVCCGVWLSAAEGEAWVAAGLLRVENPDGRRYLVAAPAAEHQDSRLERWISDVWQSSMRVQHWAPARTGRVH